jgi:hypothetical protein
MFSIAGALSEQQRLLIRQQVSVPLVLQLELANARARIGVG